jgi:hypothetical protein
MSVKRVNYGSSEIDSYGMPSTYRSYVIVGRSAQPGEAAPTDGIAKVYAISADAIPLNPDHVIAAGGVSNAVNAAIEKLRKLNAGLIERISDDQLP